jgi:elongation factor Tu
MNRAHDIEGVFCLLRTGGRSGPVHSGYRPAHKLFENYLTSGIHEYVDAEKVAPGESVQVKVWLITPEVYPASLWEGREVTVHEGEHMVGSLKVIRILNPILGVESSKYNPIWSEPHGLKGK